MDQQANQSKPSYNKTLSLSVNPWWLVAVLALLSVGLLLAWRPWDGASKTSDRTVQVSGTTTLKAEPDEYVFYPNYEFKNADKAAGLAQLTAKSGEVVAGLKKAGVADKDIKTNATGYRDYYYYDQESKTHTYSLQVTATTHTREAAQKAQDYLVTTNPTGAVTPQATFSEAKRKELESKGRDAATKDARAKADQQAGNLGFKVGKIKSVSDDGYGFGGYPMLSSMGAKTMAAGDTASLEVQPGQNELTYTVQVIYYIR
jgi:uncharacterized protein YggE